MKHTIQIIRNNERLNFTFSIAGSGVAVYNNASYFGWRAFLGALMGTDFRGHYKKFVKIDGEPLASYFVTVSKPPVKKV